MKQKRSELVDPDDMDGTALQSDNSQKPKVPLICCGVTPSNSTAGRNSEILGWWRPHSQVWYKSET